MQQDVANKEKEPTKLRQRPFIDKAPKQQFNIGFTALPPRKLDLGFKTCCKNYHKNIRNDREAAASVESCYKLSYIHNTLQLMVEFLMRMVNHIEPNDNPRMHNVDEQFSREELRKNKYVLHYIKNSVNVFVDFYRISNDKTLDELYKIYSWVFGGRTLYTLPRTDTIVVDGADKCYPFGNKCIWQMLPKYDATIECRIYWKYIGIMLYLLSNNSTNDQRCVKMQARAIQTMTSGSVKTICGNGMYYMRKATKRNPGEPINAPERDCIYILALIYYVYGNREMSQVHAYMGKIIGHEPSVLLLLTLFECANEITPVIEREILKCYLWLIDKGNREASSRFMYMTAKYYKYLHELRMYMRVQSAPEFAAFRCKQVVSASSSDARVCDVCWIGRQRMMVLHDCCIHTCCLSCYGKTVACPFCRYCCIDENKQNLMRALKGQYHVYCANTADSVIPLTFVASNNMFSVGSRDLFDLP